MNEFYNKKGRLTRYALACGYIERFEEMGNSVTLWMEHGCIHVRQHSHIHNKRIFWESFENLNEARKRFDQAKKKLKESCFCP